MNEVLNGYGIDEAKRKKAGELTLEDCSIIARAMQVKDDPYAFDDFYYRGDNYMLNIWVNDDEPDNVNLAVFDLYDGNQYNADNPVQLWTVDYNQTETWR